LLTGCRLREILHLRWTNVDLERGVLTLVDSKTGRKNVLLGVPAIAVLSELAKDGNFVIAGKNPDKPRSDLHRPWSRIIEHAGLKGLRLHDLRHSFASVGAASGMGLPALGRLLGHRSPETTNRYAHFGDDPLRRASDRLAGEISAVIGQAAIPLLQRERRARTSY
jgi:integrase